MDATAVAPEKQKVGTIDITPSWVGLLPMYLAVLADGGTAANSARSELYRMARIADAYRALQSAENH